MTTIVQQEAAVLRQQAKEVPLVDIKSATTRKLLTKMSKALAEQDDGVALAAPQIGETKRIFIISGKMLLPAGPVVTSKSSNQPADLVFINPKIIKSSRKKAEVEEGCLSVRWLYGLTKRSTKASVEAYNERGQKFTRHGTGVMAQIFQHEIDHLNGILFIDHATAIREIKSAKHE